MNKFQELGLSEQIVARIEQMGFTEPTEVQSKTIALLLDGRDVIASAQTGTGAYKYDEKQDVVRFAVKPVTLDKPVETFTIDFNDIRDESATLDLAWEKTLVPIKMEVSYVADLEKQIEKVMASNEPNKPYFQAAAFWYNHNKDMNQAKAWIDEALKEREAFYMMYLKAEILERLGDKAGAVAASKKSLELAQQANDNGYVKLNENLLARLK